MRWGYLRVYFTFTYSYRLLAEVSVYGRIRARPISYMSIHKRFFSTETRRREIAEIRPVLAFLRSQRGVAYSHSTFYSSGSMCQPGRGGRLGRGGRAGGGGGGGLRNSSPHPATSGMRIATRSAHSLRQSASVLLVKAKSRVLAEGRDVLETTAKWPTRLFGKRA